MTLQEWLDQEKKESPDLEDFLTKINPYITDTGFNAIEFERKVGFGIRKADSDIDDALKPDTNVEN